MSDLYLLFDFQNISNSVIDSFAALCLSYSKNGFLIALEA